MLTSSSPRDIAVAPLVDEPLADDDFHLALYLCYELHYASIEGVDPAWEWDPALLALRAAIEREFESALHDLVPDEEVAPQDAIDALKDAIASDDAPSVSRFIQRDATLDQVEEFMKHRSAYQLKEADPHTWLIPRLRGKAKAALVEIQSDEYGGGRPDRVHSHLFAKAMSGMGLDATYGAYVDDLPGTTLATVNLVSMFCLHRRLRGAGVGHLAVFETLSSEPNGRYARGLRRLGFDGHVLDFFDEHVEADSVHEVIALHDLVGGLVHDEPALAGDVVWGARCLLAIDERWARHVMSAWEKQMPSLRAREHESVEA